MIVLSKCVRASEPFSADVTAHLLFAWIMDCIFVACKIIGPSKDCVVGSASA